MPPKLYIGTSGWNYYDWKDRFYPADSKPREYLAYYSRHFPTTEVNYSFYHLPKPTTYQNWAAQVPDNFVFAVKTSRVITHIRRLKDVADEWQLFLDNASALGRKLGPVLLQFPPSFKKNAGLLAAFLQESPHMQGPTGVRLALEFRHASWFDDEIRELAYTHGSTLALAHSQRYPQASFDPAAPFVYLRLHGPGALFASSYSRSELGAWARQIRGWMASGKSVYIYFNNDFGGYAIENAKALTGLLPDA